MFEQLFPSESNLQVDHVAVADEQLEIYASTTVTRAQCPQCGIRSQRRNSFYQRHPMDLPCFGYKVRLNLTVQRFFCDNEACKRVTFAESFPGLVAYKARRTERLSRQQLSVAFELGGETGKRILAIVSMGSSGDTLLRDILQAPEPIVDTPRVLGIDDWANCKGRTYGTIFVDLETHQPVDLLDTREASVVEAWLKMRPGVEIICRDRGKEYIKAASSGAPDAEQVADRWHLLKNIREMLQTILTHKPECLKAAAQRSLPDEDEEPEQCMQPQLSDASEVDMSSPLKNDVTLPVKPTKAQQDKAAVHSRRQARYDQVRQLHRDGHSMRGIARLMKMSKRTVKKYVEADACPQYTTGRVQPSKLNRYLPYLEDRWQSGCTNASQLWRELRDQHGFAGSRGLVARWAAKQRQLLPAPARYRRQQKASLKPQLAHEHKPTSWSASRASWLLIRDLSELNEEEAATVNRITAADGKVAKAIELVQSFIAMVKKRKKDGLITWLEDARSVRIRALTTFVNGIYADFEAVYNALKMEWSAGQTEGQINRLKFIKRQGYGRAKFGLLRRRVLYQPGSL
jgi:transposase